MSITFGNPPLIEIIVEFHWVVKKDDSIPIPQFITSAEFNKYVTKFRELLGTEAREVDHLVPPMLPILQVGNPVVRFKNFGDDAKLDGAEGIIYHLGPGVFSVNGVSNYKSWASFSEHVQKGLDYLHQSFGEDIKYLSSSRIRYINLFGSRFLDGKGSDDFLREQLGVDVRYPNAILSSLASEKTLSSFVKIDIPLADKRQMIVFLGPRDNDPEKNVVLDSTIVDPNDIDFRTDLVMSSLAYLKDIIHNMFVELTKSLHDRMK